MWRIYSPNHLGVRISVERKEFKAAATAAGEASGERIIMKNVRYVNQKAYQSQIAEYRDDLRLSSNDARSSNHLFLKRLPFEHERETRCVLFASSQTTKTAAGCKFKLPETRGLIKDVLFDPRLPVELAQALGIMLRHKLRFEGRIAQSSLYAPVRPIDFFVPRLEASAASAS